MPRTDPIRGSDRNTAPSDDLRSFLDRLFESDFQRLALPNLMRKSDYHELAALVPRELMDDEVRQTLDAIVEVADRANPAEV